MVECARSSGGSEGGKGEEEGLLLLLAGSLAGWLAGCGCRMAQRHHLKATAITFILWPMMSPTSVRPSVRPFYVAAVALWTECFHVLIMDGPRRGQLLE